MLLLFGTLFELSVQFGGLVRDLIGSSRTILSVFTKSYVTDFGTVFYFCNDTVRSSELSAATTREDLGQFSAKGRSSVSLMASHLSSIM
jgi:hypothetical protein